MIYKILIQAMTLAILLALIGLCNCLSTHTMYVNSLSDIDTTRVRITHIDSTRQGHDRVYIVECRDRKSP